MTRAAPIASFEDQSIGREGCCRIRFPVTREWIERVESFFPSSPIFGLITTWVKIILLRLEFSWLESENLIRVEQNGNLAAEWTKYFAHSSCSADGSIDRTDARPSGYDGLNKVFRIGIMKMRQADRQAWQGGQRSITGGRVSQKSWSSPQKNS